MSFQTRAARLVAVFTAMYVLGLSFSISALNTVDEAWFVQVVSRMRAGDVLYRDVSYGAGPLPAYLTEAATYLVGVDVLAEKLVTVLAFAGSATLAWVAAERLGLGPRARLLTLAGVAYFCPPLQLPPYGPLAATFVVVAVVTALVGRTAKRPSVQTRMSIAGGAACGLAFVSKQNVGAYALLAFVVILLVDRRVRNAVYAIGAFAAVSTLVLSPVVISGGFRRYVDYGFTGKGEYVHAGIGPFGSFADLIRQIGNVDSPATAQAAYWAVGLILPCLAALSLCALLPAIRRQRHPALIPLLAFSAAAAVTLYPRFDASHIAFAGAPLVLLLAYSLHAYRGRIPGAAWFIASVWLGFAIASMITLPVRMMLSPATELSELPHLRAAFVQRSDEAQWRREALQLVAAARGDSDGLFLIGPHAGFRYLTTGLRNPTPFDYPARTTFGRRGEERVIAALRSRSIRRVCIDGYWSGMEPRQLANYVRSTMRRLGSLGFCTLYESAR